MRPERISIASVDEVAAAGDLTLTGVIVDVQYHGASTRYVVATDGAGSIAVVGGNAGRLAAGETVKLSWFADDMHELGADDGAAG